MTINPFAGTVPIITLDFGDKKCISDGTARHWLVKGGPERRRTIKQSPAKRLITLQLRTVLFYTMGWKPYY